MVEGAEIGMHSQPSCVDLKNIFRHYLCLTI